jgi:DNA polymerase-4
MRRLPASFRRSRLAAVETDMVTLCRDCLTCFSDAVGRCPHCGGPRLVSHPELTALSIAHVDCDAFYAAVEKRDDPRLADKPVIVGGAHRGVVAAACYVARTFGVHSAMPMFKALKACPQAVVIAPDMAKYAAVGRQVRDLMLALTPAVEPLSIDEAFLDLSGTERLHGAPPAVVLAHFQQRVEREIGVTASVGLSHTKFLAKIASDLDKPRGFAVIGRAETLSFLAKQPVSIIWGVGAKTQERLVRDGFRRMADLQKQDEKTLARRYGAMGLRLARLARGEDDRSVSPERKAKSISAETTFDRDYADAADLLPRLRQLSERVSSRLKRQGLCGRLVVLKLKSADFRLRTRNVHLDQRTNLADRVFRAGRDLLRKELDGTKYRLIGIGVGELADADLAAAHDLIDGGAEKRAQAERAMDDIRSRYGPDGLALGLTFTAKTPRGKPSAR